MKLSYNLRKLLLFQTLVAVAIVGSLAWHRWNYLLDDEYWKYLELREQLSSVPLKVGDWEGTIETERIFPAQFDKESQGVPSSAFASLHQVFQHEESGEEVLLYLGAGSTRDMYRWSFVSSYRHDWEEVGEFAVEQGDSAVPVSFREVFVRPILNLPDKPPEQPSIWLTAVCKTGNWKIPNRHNSDLTKDNYRIWIGTHCENENFDSEAVQAAKKRIEAFARFALPEIDDAIFSTSDSEKK